MNKSLITFCIIAISFLLGCNDQNTNTIKDSDTIAVKTSINSMAGKAPSVYCGIGVVHLTFASGSKYWSEYSNSIYPKLR